MKKNNLLLNILLVSIGIFITQYASSMNEEIPFGTGGLAKIKHVPTKTSKKQQEVSSVLPDVQKNILTQLLRLILDEVEDNPQVLLSKQNAKYLNYVSRYLTDKPTTYYESANNIDFIIKLIVGGADPNTKSYKGNNVLQLLIEATNLQKKPNFTDFETKIKLLARYGININAKDAQGDTLGHELIELYMRSREYLTLITYLLDKGLNITSIKNNAQQTPLDLGQQLIEAKINKTDNTVKIINLIVRWQDLLLMTTKQTKNYYGRLLWHTVQTRINQLVDQSQVESVLNSIKQITQYTKFMTIE